MQSGEHTQDHRPRFGQTVLLDVTRLVAMRWTGRQPNGIDRVCLAYLRHFRSAAHAVVQHRGLILVFGGAASRRLFDHLDAEREAGCRTRLAGHLAGALIRPRRPSSGDVYLNVSHTDFDLPVHARWVRRHRLRAIYLLHDLIPILHPAHCRDHAVVRHTRRVEAALRLGAGIIVGSATVEGDLHRYARDRGIAAPPVARAALAGAEFLHRVPERASAGDYFLCIGTIESRKNHILLHRVWERIRCRLGSAAPSLVLVGRWGTGVTELRREMAASSMAGGSVRVVTNCGDEELASLLVGARAVLMPTLAEGFGLPMAEALSLGVPVIASDLPIFREVGQGVPCLLDPEDIDAWCTRIFAMDRAAAQRQRRIDALHGYRAPTWHDHFACIDHWLAAIAAPPAHMRADDGVERHAASGDGRAADQIRKLIQ